MALPAKWDPDTGAEGLSWVQLSELERRLSQACSPQQSFPNTMQLRGESVPPLGGCHSRDKITGEVSRRGPAGVFLTSYRNKTRTSIITACPKLQSTALIFVEPLP